MKCYNGIKGKQGLIVPCGQCMNCRVNSARNWTTRILLEEAFHPEWAWFLTLTYDDKHVPVTTDYVPTLRRSDFSDFIREAHANAGPFRFYGVGEYGSRTLRPHYHMALFPQSDCQMRFIAGLWNRGFTSAYPLNAERARYLAQYTTKKLTKDTDPRLERDQEPEFRTSTRRPPLGSAAIPEIVARYRTPSGRKILAERGDVERTVRFQGRVYPIPPYVLEKVRQQVSIPVRHADRLCHPGYFEWHQQEEAMQCPETHEKQEKLRHAKARRQQAREYTL